MWGWTDKTHGMDTRGRVSIRMLRYGEGWGYRTNRLEHVGSPPTPAREHM
jgi:hypothetical protein